MHRSRFVKSHLLKPCIAYFSLNKLLLIVDNVSFFKAVSSVSSLNGNDRKKRPVSDCNESPKKKVKMEDDDRNKVSSAFISVNIFFKLNTIISERTALKQRRSENSDEISRLSTNPESSKPPKVTTVEQ